MEPENATGKAQLTICYAGLSLSLVCVRPLCSAPVFPYHVYLYNVQLAFIFLLWFQPGKWTLVLFRGCKINKFFLDTPLGPGWTWKSGYREDQMPKKTEELKLRNNALEITLTPFPFSYYVSQVWKVQVTGMTSGGESGQSLVE